MTKKKQRLIVVLGMHRSGTSVVTRGLKVMGVHLGDRLLDPIKGVNEKGFWEDRDLYLLNVAMLNELNREWFHLASVEPIDVEILHKKGYFLQAVEMLRQKTSNIPVFGFKDPRIAKLLPFWKDVFNHLQFDISYVLVARNPISVAKSLAKRDDFLAEQSYLIWLGHMLPSLVGSNGARRVLVDYDRLMNSPERELTRIAKFLDLEIESTELQEYTSEFIAEDLRHTIYAPNDLLIDDACPPIVREIYTDLFDVATSKTNLDDVYLQDKLVFWSDEFERLKSPIMLLDKVFIQKTTAYQALTEHKKQIEDLSQNLTERDGQIADLSQSLTERDDQIANLSQSLTERDDQIADLSQSLTERDDQIADLSQSLTERDGQIADLSQSLTVRDGQIADLNQSLTERDGQIADLSQSLTVRDGQIADLKQGISQISKDLGLHIQQNSWVITKPLNFYYQGILNRPIIFIKRKLSNNSHRFLPGLPQSIQSKHNFKSFLFRQFDISLSQNKEIKQSAATNEYVPLYTGKALQNKPVKLICFYLPQFHAIPENNAWWGEGFTEWSNVQPAQPQFAGHYQPHIPDELGYYNLLDSGIQSRQIELAKLYGIEGFCFYFYWFGGKRLLETPIENYLDNQTLDLPFCLCWANETWSRTWDGKENDILMGQEHSPQDDLDFIQHISKYMRDHRYIRINGKPLLLVYRPSLLPSVQETAERWRLWCRVNGLGEIYLAYTQSFDMVDPVEIGFDAAIEFPPNNTAPPKITYTVTPLNKDFACTVYDWRIFVERSENYSQPDYKLFRSVCPSWDNTARRKNTSAVFLNSSPALYQHWLENAVKDTRQRFEHSDEQLIFVNAWNEWAEGAHLEPDMQYGYAWLQATRNALTKFSDEISTRKIIVVSHDAHPHGAQYLSLHLAKTLSSELGYQVDLVLLGDGVLTPEYSRWATVHDLHGVDARGSDAQALAAKLFHSGHSAAIVNTTVSGLFLETLEKTGIRCVALIHELSGVIESNKLQEHATAIANTATAVVFPTEQVAKSFNNIAHVPDNKQKIRHQGVYKRNAFLGKNETARKQLRKSLKLKDTAKIVLGVGYLDHRKGIDRFVEAGIQVAEKNSDVFFVWVGHWDSEMRPVIERRIDEAQLKHHFLFVGRKDDTDMYYAGADIYALTSREDPFPSVVMEALEVSVPVVGFKESGGFDTLLKKGCGRLVKKDDISAFAKAIISLINYPDRAQKLGRKGAAIITESFSFRHYLYDLLELANLPLKRVSVIVPNYNYAHYLEQRIESIINQSYPIFEMIILDDASTDNSIEVIKKSLANTCIDYRLIQNKKNSGSVFKQWQRGIDLARGDYIWICEADDYASTEFIKHSIALFDDDQLVISYTQSKQVDENGLELSESYLDYTDDICQQKWLVDHISDGNEELSTVQAIKNTIPNVSAVIFRKPALVNAMQECQNTLFKLRIAGDWLIYANMLKQGKVGHVADSLNSHRRHQSSVTASSSSNAHHLAEIIFMQDYVASLSEPDEEVRRRAKAYVEKIYKQFNLDTRFVHNPIENIDVKQALDSIS